MRCAVCGSERLSPLGELVPVARYGSRMQLLFKRPGFLQPRPTFDVKFARACRDCGAVIPFLRAESRRRLDATADEVIEMPDPDEPEMTGPEGE